MTCPGMENYLREQVIEHEERITFDKNIDLKMQSAVLARHIGIDVLCFTSALL